MERRRCAACEQAFRPRSQSPGQLYCGQAACQRERRRRWQRDKRQRDGKRGLEAAYRAGPGCGKMPVLV
jgi:hypothetical protein